MNLVVVPLGRMELPAVGPTSVVSASTNMLRGLSGRGMSTPPATKAHSGAGTGRALQVLRRIPRRRDTGEIGPLRLLRRGAAVALRITRHHTAFAGVADEINADVELGGQYGQHLAHLVDR